MPQDYSDVEAVFPLKTYAITDVDTGTEDFVIAGDHTSRFLVGDILEVVDSTGNDGTYTVSATAYASGPDETTITVNEDVTNATVDGTIIHDEVSDFLQGKITHDDADDRDLDIPDQFAGAHARRISNEIRALGQLLRGGLGFSVLDGGGLIIYHGSGTVIFGTAAPVSGDPGKLTMADDTTNYIEVDSSGVVSVNAVSFTAGQYPLFTVTTVSGDITNIEDNRSSIYIADFAENVHTHPTSDVVSGTFADARIAESNVTQHEGAIDHDALLNWLITQHRIINDAGSSATELYSASKISALIAAVVAGVDHKEPVRTSTEGLGNIALTGEQTLNGVLTSTSRILVTEQTLGETNGIYVTAAGAWTRDTDADTDAEVTNGLTVWVDDSGSDVYKHQYLLVTADPITLDTTSLSFAIIPDLAFGTTAGTATEGNDSRVPTQDENNALVGTDGAPSTANPFVTDSDPRVGVDTLVWTANGALSVGTNQDGIRVAPRDGTILAVYMVLENRGQTGDNIVDINKGTPGTPHTTQQNATAFSTIYTTQANRPTLAGLNGSTSENAFIEAVDPDVTAFSKGDMFTMDVDQRQPQSSVLVVVMEVKYD